MNNESKYARLIRPIILIWFTLLFSGLMLVDGNVKEFTIKEVYISVLETLMVTTYGFFFLGRSGEKIMNSRSQSSAPTQINEKEDK